MLLKVQTYTLHDVQRTIAEMKSRRIPFHELSVYLRKLQPQALVTSEGKTIILTGNQGDLASTVHFVHLGQMAEGNEEFYDRIRVQSTANLFYLSSLYSEAV